MLRFRTNVRPKFEEVASSASDTLGVKLTTCADWYEDSSPRIRPPLAPVRAAQPDRHCRVSLELSYLANGILAAVRIGRMQDAFRVVLPLAVDQETVTMNARSKRNGDAPGTVSIFVHADRFFLPLSKIADQFHFLRLGSRERERVHRSHHN